MIGFIVKKFIGSKNEREVKKLRPFVGQINEIELGLQKLPDEALRQKTAAWKEELSKIEDKAQLAARRAKASGRGAALQHGPIQWRFPAGRPCHGPAFV